MQNQTPPVNLQDTFNRIWQHFIVEKHPKCTGEDGMGCRYRLNENGCAIGCFLPDHIATNLDSGSYGYISISNILNSERKGEVHEWLKNAGPTEELQILQSFHDSYFNEFKQKLREFAAKYNLNIPL